ncbi:zinc-dependent metalloprotease [Roseisolibacter agri]|uniref:Glutaminyl-tRNA synthetase n=1 Tax=Roseisolibacter agri TaxID=2014610 RepID=A0AA37Q2R1_9BACT|nr:zinc-dependent metalloprotease [Roseisolibacter agri]GLC25505.1 glutaminyl-tRNA synthetase [Roseisolibacter agri]
MRRSVRPGVLAALAALPLAPLMAQPPATPAQTPPAAGAPATPGGPTSAQPPRRAPRPYAQVVTARAVTDAGGITVHRVDDRWLFEVPDSLLARDFLLVSRVAGVPSNFDGFVSAGTSVEDRVVRWERTGDRLVLRSIGFDAVADDSLPIALSVASNNVGPILAAFPVQAFGRAGGRDSATAVVDVTDFFAGDTPAIAGLTAAQRRQYQVRRLDPARSYVSTVRSFPMNVEVRHTQTFDAAEPPSDRSGGALTLEMRQSLVLLPKTPMRPRYADARVGFFAVERVNYGLDEQKAASQRFIRRWRLEPKDTAAYLRGELVEPIKPIVYYLDPATPAKWRPYVRQGIQDWQKAFEVAGFRNAILAKDPPSRAEDPEWDPEDIRYSVVRWAASLVRNAVGPSTSDPRTGEIIESDITWYHNHMRSYRNRLMVETGAANPAARTLEIPEELMGETMRQVITHEVGHALGLPHNMVASSAFPVDSLRRASFVRRYGVSATIMDYARQNYVAQPGDGLAPKDFIRRLGPYDDFVINWGYRALPQARTPEDERATLHGWLMAQRGPLAYRYVPQQLGGVDPRAQTEDLGDDPVRAGTYAVANLRRVVPSLVEWTTKPGEDYDDLAELYGEAMRMWATYMNHAVTTIGGVEVDARTADQAGPAYRAVPRARQREAVAFLAEQVLRTPAWLAPEEILSRIGPQSGASSLANAQAAVLTQMLAAARLARLADAEARTPDAAYAPTAYLADVRRALWGAVPSVAAPDANRRALQRVHVERLGALVAPPAPPAGGQGAGGGGGPGGPGQQLPALLAPPAVPRTDLPALARGELRTLRDTARRSAALSAGMARAHWQDMADRIDVILDPPRGR